jgi:hypothetical protein
VSRQNTSGHFDIPAEGLGLGLGDQEHKRPLVEWLAMRAWFPTPAAVRLLGSPCFLALRALSRRIVDSSVFHVGLVAVILFNIGVLAVEANGVEGQAARVTFVANAVCTVVFSVELCLQVIALNVPTFFSSSFNVVDSFIVVISLVELSYG